MMNVMEFAECNIIHVIKQMIKYIFFLTLLTGCANIKAKRDCTKPLVMKDNAAVICRDRIHIIPVYGRIF